MPGIAEELFVDSAKIPLRLYCSICLDVAEAAVITQCDHLFCEECLEQYIAVNANNCNGADGDHNCECPNCRQGVAPITAATNARNFVSQQAVYCSEIESLRCGWTGKYSMWHTHRAKYCQRASEADKNQAKNARVTEIGRYCTEELQSMGVARLKKILQEYLALHAHKLSGEEKQSFDYKQYLEKSEYIAAVIRFQSDYGIMPNPQQNQKQTHHSSDLNAFPTTYDGLKQLKIRQLSAYLRCNNINPHSAEYRCLEKSDLIRLVLQTQKRLQDIADGNAYDPCMERNNFASFEAPQNEHIEHNMESEEKQQDENAAPSASAYHFGAEHLRRSSINRLDLNALHRERHANVDDYGALNAAAANNHAEQRMYRQNNRRSQSHSQPANPNRNRNPFEFAPQTPINFHMPAMPQMPDVSGMLDTAMNTVSSTFHHVFNPAHHHNNGIHTHRQRQQRQHQQHQQHQQQAQSYRYNYD